MVDWDIVLLMVGRQFQRLDAEKRIELVQKYYKWLHVFRWVDFNRFVQSHFDISSPHLARVIYNSLQEELKLDKRFWAYDEKCEIFYSSDSVSDFIPDLELLVRELINSDTGLEEMGFTNAEAEAIREGYRRNK